MTKLQQLITQRLALKLEMEAAEKLLEAAHLKNSRVDIQHLEVHMGTLLGQWQRATAQMYVELRNSMFPGGAS